MKRALPLSFFVAFLLTAGWLFFANKTLAASSDDAVNYVRRDPEDYNFLPLVLDPNSSIGNTRQLRDVISYNMAYDQGYEVQCAKPAWSITPQVYGAIEEYFEHHSAAANFGADATYTIDFSNGRVPLFRGDEALTDTTKVSSLEGFFGANDQRYSPPGLNSSGVANILLGVDGQCEAKYQNLESLFGEGSLCSKLEDGSECALNRPITGTSFTTQELYEKMAGLFQLSNGERNLSCSDIMAAEPATLAEFGITGNSVDRDIRITQDAITKMPLNLDILYRLAFLVIAPQQNLDEGANNVFSFLQNRSPQPNQTGGTVNQVRHAPIVVGFKVPFLATNSLFSLPNLQDSSRLTATTLRSIEEVEKEMAQVRASREQFVADILQNKETKPIINCDGMPQCSGGQDQALVQALIDMINGSGQTCSAFKGPYENAGDLGSPAAASEDKEFQDPYFSSVLPASNSAVFQWNLEVADTNAPALAAQDKVPVTAHIIAPYGTDLKFLEESMRALFGTEELEKRIQENCIEDFHGECGMIPEYFTFGGVLADLSTEDASFDFIYNDIPECDTPEGQSLPDCQEMTMGGSLTEQPREPLRILGAQIGWFIQQIQLTFRSATNRAHDYIKECKRTEDLFLGRCLGFQGKPGGSDSNVANSCNDYRGFTVDLPSSFTELGNLVCSVAGNNPNDSQLLWGLTQVDGAPMNRAIREGKGSISCGDIILNSCGAAQIVGIIVPQCIDLSACPQVGWALDDGVAGQKYREEITPDVVCSVRGTLEWILQKRKSEMAFLREEYRKANGAEPSTKQLYYMMAGRNLGLSMDILTKPACQGAGPIDTVGVCAGLNYCECVMDKLSYRCGQSV